MGLFQRLARLAKIASFRKLLLVRLATQSGDGTVQLAMASYILFSPEKQTNAWAITMVLAITLLPYSVLAPFVSAFLDRWSRRNIMVVSDSMRALIATTLALLVGSGNHSLGIQTLLFVLLLMSTSLNRFLLSGLSAALPHTIDKKSYLDANSVLPLIGPIGLMVGGIVAASSRLGLGHWLPSHRTDSLSLFVAVAFFVTSVSVSITVGRHEWGPTLTEKSTSGSLTASLRAAGTQLCDGLRHIRKTTHILIGFALITSARILFGLLTVAMMLATRHLFHDPSQANAALLDMGLWSAMSGAGFVVAPWIIAPLSQAISVRNTIVSIFGAGTLVMIFPTSIFSFIPQLVTSFLVGVLCQGVKILVDTIVQAHCDNAFKGRVFVIYDIIFNVCLVVAASIMAALGAPTGFSRGLIVGMTLTFALTGLGFFLVSKRVGADSFNRGTPLELTSETITTS